ncbi:4644_t:CDS:2 [Entrophospora sp. SA101]|nr:4644_t:CDS:2 [Entrophospora sp. SA101]
MNPIEIQEQSMDISEDNEPIFEDYDDETKVNNDEYDEDGETK